MVPFHLLIAEMTSFIVFFIYLFHNNLLLIINMSNEIYNSNKVSCCLWRRLRSYLKKKDLFILNVNLSISQIESFLPHEGFEGNI